VKLSKKERERVEARPLSGPGSRQPVLTLPSIMPDGKRTRMHPLLWALENRMPEGRNKSDVARALGIQPQSLYKWERSCATNRNFPVPVQRAAQLASYFGIDPVLLRPDFPWAPWAPPAAEPPPPLATPPQPRKGTTLRSVPKPTRKLTREVRQ
jgi:DNA-binding XRE family transcriptional regulator